MLCPLQTIATIKADKRLKFSEWCPQRFKDLFAPCEHFPKSFLHAPILSRDDTTDFLLQYTTDDVDATLYIINGLFDLFIEDLDRAIAVNRLYESIVKNILKV